jgi:hypothetical protein
LAAFLLGSLAFFAARLLRPLTCGFFPGASLLLVGLARLFVSSVVGESLFLVARMLALGIFAILIAACRMLIVHGRVLPHFGVGL